MTEQVQGSAPTQENSVPTETNPNNDKVAYETYKRVLSEAKKLKEQVRAFEEEKAKVKEESLKEQQQWKALYEQANSKLSETQKVLQEQEEAIVNGLKFQKFEEHLGGKLKNREYAQFVDFNKIILNPETKSIDEESVKAAAAEFAKKHASLVEFQTAKLPNQAAKDFGGELKLDNLKSKEDIKNAMKAILGKQ